MREHRWSIAFFVVLLVGVACTFGWSQAGSDYTKTWLEAKEVVLEPAPHAVFTFEDAAGATYQRPATLEEYDYHHIGGSHYLSETSGVRHSYPFDAWVLAMMIATPLVLLTTFGIVRLFSDDW